MKQMYETIKSILKENGIDTMNGVTCSFTPSNDENIRYVPRWYDSVNHNGFLDVAKTWYFKDSKDDDDSIHMLPDNIVIFGDRHKGKRWYIYVKTDSPNQIPYLQFRQSDITEAQERAILFSARETVYRLAEREMNQVYQQA